MCKKQHKDCVPKKGTERGHWAGCASGDKQTAQDSQQRIKDGDNRVKCSAFWGTTLETDC